MRARHMVAPAHLRRERERREDRLAPSARELLPVLRQRLLDSRPVLSIVDEGKPSQRVVYGPPTFRNRINENGEHV